MYSEQNYVLFQDEAKIGVRGLSGSNLIQETKFFYGDRQIMGLYNQMDKGGVEDKGRLISESTVREIDHADQNFRSSTWLMI